MHPSAKLFFLAVVFCFVACTKSATSSTENNQNGPGHWNLVSDSTFEGVAQNNHPVDYMGQAGDYFSFSTDGNVYTKEGEVLDTLTYRVVSATGIIISDFGATFNNHSVELNDFSQQAVFFRSVMQNRARMKLLIAFTE
jgi:hypothetical protein